MSNKNSELPSVLSNFCERCKKEASIITVSKKKGDMICLKCFNEEEEGEHLHSYNINELKKALKQKGGISALERTDKQIDITDEMVENKEI